LVPVIAGEMLDATAKISDEEVRRAAAQLKVGLLMSLESSAARIEQLGRQMLIFGYPLETEQVINAVDGVDAWAVKRVARRLLSKPPALAAVGPLSRLESHDRIAARLAA
ncbi:MAG: insulinase family protein, partial [Ferrovibrionaceae bacterium]